MSDSKTTPRNYGKSKTKTSENLQIQFKKPSAANDRLVVNKLGMKFDPVCWKKNHEKGRIQFVCIESNCNADRRLACAHCIIEEHDEHISNKVTVEQYCDTFENNFKNYLFQVAKLEEYYNKCKMTDLIDQIDKDINTILEIVKQQLKILRDFYIQDILLHAEQNNSSLIQFYYSERQTLSKIKEYAHKNLFEMTPAEMDHSMLLMDPKHLDKILNKFSEFNSSLQSTMKSQWKLIQEQLEESLIDVITQIGQNNLEFIEPTNKESQLGQFQFTNQQQEQIINQVQIQTKAQQQNLNQQRETLQNLKNSSKQATQQQQCNSQQINIYQQQPLQSSSNSQYSNSIKKEVSKYSGNTVQQQSSKQQSSNQAQSSNQQLSNVQLQSNSPKASSEIQSVKQIQGICVQQVTSPLKSGLNTASFGNLGLVNQKSLKNIIQTNTNQVPIQPQIEQSNNSQSKPSSQIRQISPNGVSYFYQSDGKQLDNKKNANQAQSLNSSSQNQQQSFDRRMSAQKIQNTQLPCNYNNIKCIHNDLIKASPVFSCCNWAFPCYECHDLISTHKAHITVPSQRFCQNCHEIFSVNLMSTVDVKCYKCQ